MSSTEPLLQPGFTAIELLERELPDALRLDAASAFVTRSGIELLAGLPRPRKVRLVCRAGHGVTEPDAVVMAADELGAEVRLVAGPEAARFHPKLYLIETRERLVVLAGSGNLTAGGLRDNVQQFELHALAPLTPIAREHQTRFNELWGQGAPLDELRSTPFWEAWRDSHERRLVLGREAQELDAALDEQAPPAMSSPDPGIAGRSGGAPMAASQIAGALDRWLPNTERRQVSAGLLADALEELHSHAPNSWALLAIRSQYDRQLRFQLMLNFHLVRLRDDGCLIVGIGDERLADEIARRFPATRRDPRGPYGQTDLTIAAVDVAAVVPVVRRAVLAHTRSRGGQAPRASHSRQAVEELERVVGRRLPRPTYD